MSIVGVADGLKGGFFIFKIDGPRLHLLIVGDTLRAFLGEVDRPLFFPLGVGDAIFIRETIPHFCRRRSLPSLREDGLLGDDGFVVIVGFGIAFINIVDDVEGTCAEINGVPGELIN